jgi:hypothetical protein
MAPELVDDFPHIVPDPPRAHVQFSVEWKGRRSAIARMSHSGDGLATVAVPLQLARAAAWSLHGAPVLAAWVGAACPQRCE